MSDLNQAMLTVGLFMLLANGKFLTENRAASRRQANYGAAADNRRRLGGGLRQGRPGDVRRDEQIDAMMARDNPSLSPENKEEA
jgi:hypothetical protein